MCLDLIENWISENLTDSIMGTDGGRLSISGIATYQPFDGMMELKVVIWMSLSCIYIEFVSLTVLIRLDKSFAGFFYVGK